MRYAMGPEQHAAIFGPRDPMDAAGPGRSRKCKVCGGWHRLDQPWPHNCRPEAPPRANFATPMIAPTFHEFVAAPGSDIDEVIGSRNEKREFMRRHGLVEHERGVGEKNEWANERDEIADIVSDIKMVEEMDEGRRKAEFGAVEMVEGGGLADGTEIEIDPAN